MKKVFLLFFVLLFSINAFPQAPNWLWAQRSSGGGLYMEGKAISVSPTTGDIYFGARLASSVLFCGVTATGTGSDDPSIDRVNNAGVGAWYQADNYGPGAYNYLYAFYRDKFDNTYSTGQIQVYPNEVYFDRYNSAGVKKLGVTIASGGNSASGYGIVSDDTGNIYISGEYSSNMTFGGYTLNYSGGGSSNTFLAKYDSNGVFKWAVSISGSGYIGGRNLTIDLSGNIYMCGAYTGTPTFGSIIATSSTGIGNFFIAKYDPSNGNALWVTPAPGAGFTHGYYRFWEYCYIVCDSCSNLYVSGHYSDTAQFGSQSIISAGGDDIFVAKCFSNGTWSWVKSAGGTGADGANSVALDKYSDVYIGGTFTNTAQFDNQAVTSAGGSDIFVAKYSNSNGDFEWVQQGGGTGNENTEGIAIDNDGFIYVIGDQSGSSTFGSTNFTQAGTTNLFLAKLDTVPEKVIIAFPDSVYCPGSSAQMPYSVLGKFNSGNTFTVQLSDSSGNFASPVNIGSVNDTTSGVISITIPANTPSGNYSIRIISSNPINSSHTFCSGGGINSALIKIGNNLNPKVSNDTTICSGTSLQLNVSSGTSYSWSPGNTLNDSTIANPIAKPNTSQTYTVTVQSGTCISSDSVAVTVNPSVIITVSPHDTTICSRLSVRLNATGGSIYSWSPAASLNNSSISNPIATPNIATTYVVSGVGACSTADTAIVKVGNATIGGTVVALRDTLCQGTRGNLTLIGFSGNPLQWESSLTPGNFTDINTTTDTTFQTLPRMQSTWYLVRVGSGNCINVSDSLMLFVPPPLVADFTTTQSGKTITFNSSSSSGNIVSYGWTFGDGTSSSAQNPLHTFAKTDTFYNVCLSVYDGSNCSYTFCKDVNLTTGIATVSAQTNWDIYPNPFSDELVIKGKMLNSKIESIEIYDMLGRTVISKTSGESNDNPLMLNVSDLSQGMY